MTQWIRQRVCGLRGHDLVLHFEDKRILLRCTACGYDSPGWTTGERPPRKRFDGDAKRHRLSPLSLVAGRRRA